MLGDITINTFGAFMAIVASLIGTFSGGGSALILFPYLKGNLWVKRAAVVMMFLLGFKMLLNF